MGPTLQQAIGEARWRLGALCPITCEPLVDPATDHEGNTYERDAIVEWLLRNPTSPLSRSPLAAGQLFPPCLPRPLR